MTDKESGWYWKLLANGLATISAIAFSRDCTLAQITPDGTLGAEGSVITPNVTINNLPAELIEGGATRGVNLFHSFSEFNVGEMQRVYFANPTGIETIFSRVIGDTSSNILGTLGVNGAANLFLLNPNGIIFGQNAQLDIRGSFVASTANRFIFPDGSEFSATNPQTPPLLTINVPIGLQYGTQPPPEIRNEGNLRVGVDLTLSGGAGDLDITANTILINNQAKLQATNTSGSGNIRINTQGLTVQNGSEITASGTGTGVSGNVEIIADSIFLNNQGNLLVTTQSGEGGNIVIDADDTLLLRYNSNILTEALGTGNGGNIMITAGNFVMAILPENSDIAATAIQGRGGNIFVTAVGIFGFSLPERLVRTPESDLSAASELGINGTMEINTRDTIRLNTLPSEFIGDGISQVCPGIGGARIQNKFIVTGRGGLAVRTDVPLSSDAVNVGLVSPVSTPEDSPEFSGNIAPTGNPHNSASKPIVEAQGWIVHPDGTPPHCHTSNSLVTNSELSALK